MDYWWAYLLLVSSLLWLLRSFFKQRYLPHGPFKFPIIGNLPWLFKDTHQKLDGIGAIYGPLFTIWFGRVPFVLINCYFAANEVLSKNGKRFSARPDIFSDILTRNRSRLPFISYCSTFNKSKHIATKILVSKNNYINKYTKEVVHSLIKEFDKYTDENISFDPAQVIDQSCVDLLSLIIYGQRVEAGYKNFTLTTTLEEPSLAPYVKLIPWAKIFCWRKYNALNDFLMKREIFLADTFLACYNEGSKECFVGKLIDSLEDKKSTEKYAFAEHLSSDVFLSGLDVFANTFRWILLYLITWPEIQDKIYTLIHENCLKEKKFIDFDDIENIPYLSAVVYESVRLSSLTPLSLPHTTTDRVTLKGYQLRKGTNVCINIRAIHHSVKYWPNPHEFNPCRFLQCSGKKTDSLIDVDKKIGYLGFGGGLRKCLGTELSIKLLATLTSNLVSKYHISLQPSAHGASLVSNSRLILKPKPYIIKVTPR